jgi:hypothetical protein
MHQSRSKQSSKRRESISYHLKPQRSSLENPITLINLNFILVHQSLQILLWINILLPSTPDRKILSIDFEFSDLRLLRLELILECAHVDI